MLITLIVCALHQLETKFYSLRIQPENYCVVTITKLATKMSTYISLPAALFSEAVSLWGNKCAQVTIINNFLTIPSKLSEKDNEIIAQYYIPRKEQILMTKNVYMTAIRNSVLIWNCLQEKLLVFQTDLTMHLYHSIEIHNDS